MTPTSAPPDDATDPRLARWASELRAVMDGRDVSATDLAREVGVTQALVSYWQKGRRRPRPDQVFAVECALRVEPGSLSCILGYRPLEPVDGASLVEAITSCDELDDYGKEAMVNSLRVHLQHSAQRRHRAGNI